MKNLSATLIRAGFIYSSILILLSCTSSKAVAVFKISGIYEMVDYGHKIVFDKNEFVYKSSPQQHLPVYNCCDTISYGEWKIDNNLIRLSTKSIASTFFNLTLTGKRINSDSITFDLRPIIRRLTVNSLNKGSEFNFILVAYNSSNMNLWRRKGNMQDSFLRFSANQHAITKVSLRVSLSGEYRGRSRGIDNIDTEPIELNQFNYLQLDIPQLKYDYFTYRRMDDDFVKIIDNKTLEWDGMIFKKSKIDK